LQLVGFSGHSRGRAAEDDASHLCDHDSDVYGKVMMDGKLEAHTKLLKYDEVGFLWVCG